MAKGKTVNPFENPSEVMDDSTAEAEELNPQQAAPETAEPATEPAAEPAAPTEPAKLADGTDSNKPVPYDRFRETNEGRKAAEARAAAAEKEATELRERWARLDERSRQINEARQAAQQQAVEQQRAAERPDPAIDPVGAKLWDFEEKTRQYDAMVAAQAQQIQALQGNMQQNQQIQAFANYVNYDVQRFQQQKPDYPAAAAHAAQKRREFWTAAGFQPEQAQEIVKRESEALAMQAMQSGKSVAQLVYDLATQWGYQSQQGAPQNGNGNGAASARIEQARRAQSHQGIGHLGGGGNESSTNYRNYTKAQLAEMSEAEFARVKSQPKAWAELQYAMAIADGIDPSEMGRL